MYLCFTYGKRDTNEGCNDQIDDEKCSDVVGKKLAAEFTPSHYRGLTSGRPDDQDEEKIANRIAVYHRETAPVADYYNRQMKFNQVVGVGSIDEIFADISKIIDAYV